MPQRIEVTGSMLSVASEGLDTLCNAVMEAYMGEYNTLEDLIEGEVIGTYYSPEELVSAQFEKEEYDISEGIFVADMARDGEYAGRKFNPYGEIMEALYYDRWLDDPIIGQCAIVIKD